MTFGMKFDRKIVVALALSIGAITFFNPGDISAASNGGKCTKAGVSQKTKGVTYICVRNGKTLKWVRKPAKATKPTVPAAASGAQLLLANPPSPEPLSNCRLTDARPFKAAGEWQAITYPATPNHGFTNAGTVDVAVVFVDFPDVAGGSAELSEHIAEIKKSAEWYSWLKNTHDTTVTQTSYVNLLMVQ